MQLSKRLSWIADRIAPTAVPADIGCDHGKLALGLIEKGCQRVYAVDISRDSLKKAELAAAQAGVSDRLIPVLGDGLSGWKYEVPDAVVIAGLSGHTMAHILEEGLPILRAGQDVFLQPMQSRDVIREYLATHGWEITEEGATWEAGRCFFFLRVRWTGEPQPLRDDWETSPYLAEKKDPAYRQWLILRRENDEKKAEKLARTRPEGYLKKLEILRERREREAKILRGWEEEE